MNDLKFHLNKKGKAAECKAKKTCPLGGQHYDSLPQAMRASFELDAAVDEDDKFTGWHLTDDRLSYYYCPNRDCPLTHYMIESIPAGLAQDAQQAVKDKKVQELATELEQQGETPEEARRHAETVLAGFQVGPRIEFSHHEQRGIILP